MAWHEAVPDRPNYLFKLKLSSRVRAALHEVKETDWKGPGILGTWQLAEGEVEPGLPATSWMHTVIHLLHVRKALHRFWYAANTVALVIPFQIISGITGRPM